MPKSLHASAWIFMFLAACSTSSQNSASKPIDPKNSRLDMVETHVISQGNRTIVDTAIYKIPSALTDLPVSQDGEIILSEGFYETEFRSYCLQPGTPSPSDHDAYLQAPLNSYRKDIVESVLRNSIGRPHLDQKNIQLLLWSIVSGSSYNKLPAAVQYTATQLLTSKQIFQLKGGYAELIKTSVSFIPESNVKNVYRQMNNLFELGNASYEAYERIAVPRGNSVIHQPAYQKDQWYQQPEGYYVRYFPNDYKKVKVQVYVPKGLPDSTRMKNGNYLVFDPVTMMAIPGNSNAQRLGIGGPVIEIVRKVILIEKQLPKGKQKKPETKKPPVYSKNT